MHICCTQNSNSDRSTGWLHRTCGRGPASLWRSVGNVSSTAFSTSGSLGDCMTSPGASCAIEWGRICFITSYRRQEEERGLRSRVRLLQAHQSTQVVLAIARPTCQALAQRVHPGAQCPSADGPQTLPATRLHSGRSRQRKLSLLRQLRHVVHCSGARAGAEKLGAERWNHARVRNNKATAQVLAEAGLSLDYYYGSCCAETGRRRLLVACQTECLAP